MSVTGKWEQGRARTVAQLLQQLPVVRLQLVPHCKHRKGMAHACTGACVVLAITHAPADLICKRVGVFGMPGGNLRGQWGWPPAAWAPEQ